MLLRVFTLFLVATLLLPAADIRARALGIPTGSPVEITTRTKQSFRGKLVTVSEAGVTIQVMDQGAITERTLAFDEIKSFRQTNKQIASYKVVLITLGFLYVIGALVSLAFGG